MGSTTTDFRIRFRNHKSAMLTNKTTCEVAVHFNKIPHTLGKTLWEKPLVYIVLFFHVKAITQLLRTVHMIVLKKAIAELSEQTTETMDP